MAPDDRDDDIAGAVARGEIAPVYCLSGERYLVDAAHAAIRAAVLGQAGAAAGFNHDTFELKESGLEACLGTARTLPMMAKRRLVVGKGIDQVKADLLEPLVAYVADPNPSTCLVLIADKVDVRFKAFVALRKAGFLHVFQPLRDNALAGWLRTEARARKIEIAGDAAGALAELAGPELGRLSQALDQLALYAGVGRPITVDDVEELIAETRQRNVFELTKAIGAGDVPRALGLLANMLRNREPALRIQFMLARQMRQIWRAKELVAAGAARGEIAGAIGMSPYFLDDVLVPAKRMSRATLARAFERLYRSDVALKSSRVDEELLISRLVQSLAEDAGTRPGAAAR
ncbi:MAG TPA: DNA polymerase III subunit delta [Polyangia bacterium]|nr:DNA polymerase III subunit delta [Polyangia bacterium]